MTKPLRELQKYQANANLTSLRKDIRVSIDRLTVLLDSDQSLRRIFRELRQALEKLEISFHIQDNLQDDTFTLSKLVEDDYINVIFFQLSQYGGFEVIRIDFNPNSLKEYHGQTVWRQILTYAKLNRLEIRLSRVDLAAGKPYQEHRRGFATAKKAFEARTRVMNKLQQKGAIKYTNWTYKQFMEEIFMPNFYSTTSLDIEKKSQVIFDEFMTTFGKKKPRNITTYDILSYRNDLLERHSNTYARSKMALLNQTLKSAKKHGLIFHKLPTANVDPIPIVKKPVDFWTNPEFETIIKSLDRDSYFEQFIFTLLWLYYFTGMRVNEATALYWEDIDFDRKTLTISHNLQYVNRQNWVRHYKIKAESSRRVIGLDD